MIEIKVDDDTATWEDGASTRTSKEILFERLMNSTIPEIASRVDAPLFEGGLQGLALKGARDFFGDKLVIVKQTEATYPEEEEGVVI